MTHKEMAAHIRNRIKAARIKARVRMLEYCGCRVIQVNAPTFDAEFTEGEQGCIKIIASVNKLTFARGLPIDLNEMTNSKTFEFYLTE